MLKNFLLIVLILFLALCLQKSAFAEEYSWEFSGWEGGGCYPNIEFDPNIKNRVYLTSDVAGIWRSDDLGEHWNFITQGLGNLNVAAIKIDPKDSNILYAATKTGVYLSQNAGQTWAAVSYSDPDFNYERLNPKKQSNDQAMTITTFINNPSIVTDIKANPTWDWANPRGKVLTRKTNPFDPNVIFITNWWGVFRSDDGGKTWTEKIKGAPNTVGSDIKVTTDAVWVATMDNGLLKSNNGGQSYEMVFPSGKYDHAKAGHVWRVILPADNTIIATSSPWNDKVNQVIVSQDGGKNFQLVRDGLPKGRPKENTMWGQGYPRALAFDPRNPQKIYLGIDGDDGGGLFISENGGFNWSRSSGQPGSLRIYNALELDPTNSNRIFWGACAKGGGVYVSNDSAKTWKRTLSDMTWVFDLAVSPSGRIYAAGSYDGATVFVSDSHGRFWKKVKIDNKGAAEALAIDPTNEKRIVVSQVFWGAEAAGKVYLSEDAGRTWKNITGNLPPGAGAAAMAFSPDGKYLYMSRYAGSVYRLKIDG